MQFEDSFDDEDDAFLNKLSKNILILHFVQM